MSSHTRNELIGKSFEAAIGEPWDFKSVAGQNKLAGVVLATSGEASDTEWLLLKNEPFNHNGVEVKQVVGVNRYSSSQDVFDQLLASTTTTLNFMFTIDGHELTEKTVFSELTNESNFGFLVGSVNKIDW